MAPTMQSFAALAAQITAIRDHPRYFAKPSAINNIAFTDGGRHGDHVVSSLGDIACTDPLAFCVVAEVKDDGFLTPDGNSVLDKDDVNPPKTKLRLVLREPRHPACAAVAKDDWPKLRSHASALLKKQGGKKGSATFPQRLPFNKETSELVIMHSLMVKREGGQPIDPLTLQNTVQADAIGTAAHGADAGAGNATANTADTTQEQEVEQHLDGAHLDDNAAQGEVDVDLNIAALLTVAGWPGSAKWHEKAAPFEDTHDVLPMPAYTADGSLIFPTDYEDVLIGATVKASFTLVTYCIQGKQNVLVAQLEELVVLSPAPKRVAQGQKRKMQLLEKLASKRVRSI